ncbi:hypothetical protein C8R44DRAFT_750277 [Mycena epipterygia]|nr:hypothetical protein C8R44DRAFT_750277 [Mycena epipterygia]
MRWKALTALVRHRTLFTPLIILLDCGFLWLDAGVFGGAGWVGMREGYLWEKYYSRLAIPSIAEGPVTMADFFIVIGDSPSAVLREMLYPSRPYLAILPRIWPLYIYAGASFYPALFVTPPERVSARLSFSAARDFEYEDEAFSFSTLSGIDSFLSLRRNAPQTAVPRNYRLSASLVAQITVLLKNLCNRRYHELLLSHAAPNTSHSFVSQDKYSAFIVRLHRPAPYHTIIDLDVLCTPLSILTLSPSTSRISHSDVVSAQDTAPMHVECFPAPDARRVVLKTSTSPKVSTSTSQA